MFAQRIESTAFTTQAANDYFTAITGDSFLGDNTMVSTLRAILYPRLEEGDTVTFCMGSYSAKKEAVEERGNETIVWEAISDRVDNDYNGRIVLINLVGLKADTSAVMEAIREKFLSVTEGYVECTGLNAWLGKRMSAACYSNAATKSAVFFVESLNLWKLHSLESCIIAALPWYQTAEKKVTVDEVQFLDTLNLREPDEYLSNLEKMVERYNLEASRVKKLLTDFQRRNDRVILDGIQNNLDNWTQKIQQYENEIASYYKKIEDERLRQFAIQNKLEGMGDDSELVDYFLANKKIYLYSVDGTEFTICIKDYMSYFSQEAAESIVTNKNAVMYRSASDFGVEKAMKLMKEIFLSDEPRVKMRLCGAFTLSLNGNLNVRQHFQFPAGFENYFHNPHLSRYGCTGTNGTLIQKALQRHDIITAIEQCVVSVKDLTLTDGAVMEEFSAKIFGSGSHKCFELPDGKTVNAEGAVMWLEAQDEKKEEK